MQIVKKNIWGHDYDVVSPKEDHLVVEQPMEITLSYPSKATIQHVPWATTMRTPGHDTELIRGVLFTEQIIASNRDIRLIKCVDPEHGNRYRVYLSKSPEYEPTERRQYVNSSCGICGKSSIDEIKRHIIHFPTAGYPKFKGDAMVDLSNKVASQMPLFNLSGGIHACATIDTSGNVLKIYEDVGRHNALDKLIGFHLAQQELPLTSFGVFLSGRASFEMIQKAALAGIPLIIAVGAPTSLAVEMAEESGITLIGFLKNRSFNIYTFPERVL